MNKRGPKTKSKADKIDIAQLEKLSALHLSDETIASILGCHADTLKRNFASIMLKSKSNYKAKLLSVLFDEGVNKRNIKAIELMLKRHPDLFKEVVHIETGVIDQNLNYTNLNTDEKTNLIQLIKKSRNSNDKK